VEEVELPIGNSHQMQLLRQTMKNLAQDLNPVFFSGQSGADLGIMARYLFSLQKTRVGLVPYSSGIKAYQNGLAENIFISEVTELSHEQQKKLLSLLNHLKSVASSGRLIVASRYGYDSLRNNRDVLPELAEQWKNAVYILSLNERIEDIPELVEYYVTWFSEKEGLPYRHFGVAGQNMFRNYFWQGGLTELKEVIRKILANSTADDVDLAEIQQFLQISQHALDEKSENFLKMSINLDFDLREAREFFERRYLSKQLELCNYNISELSRKIGQERTNLYRKLKSLGLQTRK
jgi:DNA-binding NtrC family response regulator